MAPYPSPFSLTVPGDADHTVEAIGEAVPPKVFTITASAHDGATIDPSGTVIVNEGESVTFVITAQPGSQIKSVLLDGAEVSP